MERIRYHVPEDGDDAAHPNVFELVSEGAVRVGDVRRHFPLPGRFHLRFRRRVAGLEVWADAADEEDDAEEARLQEEQFTAEAAEKAKKRLKLWRTLFKNVNRTADELYYLCEFESDADHASDTITQDMRSMRSRSNALVSQ